MPDKDLFIGVDLGGTNIAAGVVDAKHKVVASAKKKTKPDKGVENVLDRIVEVAEAALDEAKLKAKDVAGLGIGAPGAIDQATGVVLNAPNLRWTKYPLAEELGGRLAMPVTIDNDVNVGTWGEYVAGAGKGHENVLGIFVGTGIGGGLILGGKLYHGHYHTAGEVGHVVIHADAPMWRRSLEQTASRTAITAHIRKLIESNHPSKMSDIVEGDLSAIRSKAIKSAMDAEDEVTLACVGQAAKYVGIAIANLVTVLSLPCVVLGGGVTEALGKPWVKLVRRSFDNCVFPKELRECSIVAGELGDDAGIVGAADLARRRLGVTVGKT